MELLGVGAMEALLVLVVALIVVGPHRFPEIARQGGRWFRVARRYASEVTRDVRGAVEELQSEIDEEREELRSIRDLGDEVEADLRGGAPTPGEGGTAETEGDAPASPAPGEGGPAR